MGASVNNSLLPCSVPLDSVSVVSLLLLREVTVNKSCGLYEESSYCILSFVRAAVIQLVFGEMSFFDRCRYARYTHTLIEIQPMEKSMTGIEINWGESTGERMIRPIAVAASARGLVIPDTKVMA